MNYFTVFMEILLITSSIVCGPTVYTQKEKAALEKFRPLVKDVLVQEYQKEDKFLIRWLRIRNFDIDEAVEMLREAQKWRKENKIDSILSESIFEFKHPPYTIDTYDKEGSPVIIFSPTKLDPKKFLRSGGSTKVVRYWDQIIEEGGVKLRAAQVRQAAEGNFTGPEITQVVTVFDLDGFNARQHLCLECIRVYAQWVTHFENYHPNSVKYLIMINTPRAAVPMLEIIKPLLSQSTSKGFKVFGPEKSEWSQFLRKIIPAENLPFKLGGTRAIAGVDN